jgi:hypothetical protein
MRENADTVVNLKSLLLLTDELRRKANLNGLLVAIEINLNGFLAAIGVGMVHVGSNNQSWRRDCPQEV